MSREPIDEETRALLGSGRLHIERVDAGVIRARCRGANDIHELGYRAGAWYCSCGALAHCIHLAALQALVRRRDEPGRP
jgi:hypothetical protein